MKYKHIVISQFGGPENLLLAEDELLEPRANEVRVKVLASGAYGGTPTTDLESWLMMFTLNLVPDKKEFMLYSIQTLKRLKPDWFHEDSTLLLNLLEQGKIKPTVAARMPLNQAAQAHELLASGSVKGKIVLICND
jgi:NADPH:quinone reductase-like Zn-dependent oxidoreductase